MNIKKGDNVIILTGSDKGKKGAVLKVLRDEGRVIVEGVNIRKIHKRKTSNKPGTMFEHSLPINASNVALLDPKGNKATRVSSQVINGKKVRIAAKSKQEIK